MNLRQFKLTNGDEIVADIVEVAEEGDLVIRSVLKIFQAEDMNNGIRYYSFKPWLSFQDELNEITVLNIGHVIGETAPSEELLKHYSYAILQIANESVKKALNIDELEKETAGLTDDELRDYMSEKLNLNSDAQTPDSSNNNVIEFKTNWKDKLH